MVINRQFGEFILLRRLAVGGQSEVFLAMKQGPATYTRPVVIKALPTDKNEDERHRRLFYREAFISSRFIHPNVINVHNAEIVEGTCCMMMDFVTGQTVADIAQRGYQRKSPPTLKQVVQMIADACNGLHYVHNFRDLDNHQYSVVHRDVSPQNLMVTYNGDTMIFDFGIARIIGMDDDEQLGGGKYAYMSPEQLQGQPVDPRSDIFSLGVILYELATGFRLFRRNSQPEVINAVLEAPIQPPRELKPEIPQFLDNVIMRALERDPFKRYQSASDMRKDLQQFLDMTSEGGDLRRGLGTYVSALFKEERTEIAMTLQNAPKIVGDSTPFESDQSLADIGVDSLQTNDSTMELASREEIIQAARARQMTPMELANQIKHSSSDEELAAVPQGNGQQLESELQKMKNRQTWLFVVIAVLSCLAVLALAT